MCLANVIKAWHKMLAPHFTGCSFCVAVAVSPDSLTYCFLHGWYKINYQCYVCTRVIISEKGHKERNLKRNVFTVIDYYRSWSFNAMPFLLARRGVLIQKKNLIVFLHKNKSLHIIMLPAISYNVKICWLLTHIPLALAEFTLGKRERNRCFLIKM